MQAVQVVLFVVVAALALTLIGYLVRPRLGRRREVAGVSGVPAALPAAAAPASAPAMPDQARAAAVGGPGLVCPACRREYAVGLKYCPHDARALVPAGDLAILRSASSMTCPGCKRSFEANKKFCPYDAEELVPVGLAMAGAHVAAGIPRVLGKICPHCAQRYESEATFCGRDGSELVSVN
jgi:predicted amidophosphoribosyltransferase